MSWLIGAGLGLLRGGPLGAIVGGAMQHFITKSAKRKIKRNLPGIVDESSFVVCLVVTLTKVAMTRGNVSASDVALIHKFFVKNLDYKTDDLKHINSLIDDTRRINPDLRLVMAQYKKATQSNYTLLVLALSYQLALHAHNMNKEVQDGISELAELLGVSCEEHDRIRRNYMLDNLKTPWSILGVESSANNSEIKQAYRKLVLLYHPDKAEHLGQDQAEAAHLKFLDIQDAYNALENRSEK